MGGTSEAAILGKSILVPSVQELATTLVGKSLPDRYIRDDQDPSISAVDYIGHPHGLNNNREVPIIDMEGLVAGDDVELKKLDLACQDWGFFQLINHGVSTTLVEKFKSETQEFFNLPMEEKKKYWQTPTEIEGFGQAFVVSEEQKLDWADIFYLVTFPQHLRKSHLFPKLPLPYRDTVETYSTELRKLAMKILYFLAKALEIDVDLLRNVFGEGNQSIRMNYYPACPEPNKAIGLTPHSDAVALTILLQLNDMDGLQIMKDGKWLPIHPFPNAFIVNIGDILEIVSNGKYRSILHRAVVNKSKERLSVATFYSPGHNNDIGPINELITHQSPAKFRRINMVDYWKGLFSRELDGKAYLDILRINDTADCQV